MVDARYARSPVSVTIVTYNSARFIGKCLDYLLESEPWPFPVVILDNASCDGTRAVLDAYSDRVELIYNPINNGFAGGQNQAIARTHTPWVLVLNPDVRVAPGFLSSLIGAGESDAQIGTVCGKLLTMAANFQTPEEQGKPPVLDSTGIYFTPELRHFDRGSQTMDRGQFDAPEFVFGATGAAALYRRAMIEDISISGEFFDEDFFAYREDADLSWRAQLLSWKCLYTPAAVAFHVRSVLPTNRKQVAASLNLHSVKNRFLMRIKNIDALLYKRHWAAITLRDALVFFGCLMREWSSLPAFWFVLRHWRQTREKRRVIMVRRRVQPTEIELWFRRRPVSLAAASAGEKNGSW